ncbi:hypothetical protein V6N13_140200 [Hibiscus sabdariffa]|uniref:Membrane-associated kinase regulator 6 n=1 Tax=Hibiscus sabdariffa TaxID=183260 RepID=A0ABR2QAX7_9ROSI
MVDDMETSQSLGTDSFSYSWLSDRKPSLDGLHESPRESLSSYYGESSRFLIDHNFKFDATARTPKHVVHADELFTNGFIRPVYIDPSKRDPWPCNNLDSMDTPRSSAFSSTTETPKERKVHCSFLGKSTKKILRNLFEHLRPLCHKLGCLRKSTRVDDFERRIMWRAKSWNSSRQASPTQIVARTSTGTDLCYLENPIYEAVLHCKRSIGKDRDVVEMHGGS